MAGVVMTVNHPQFGLMCEICFKGLTPAECAYGVDLVDSAARPTRWDVCTGECARQAGIAEVYAPTHAHLTRDIKAESQCPACDRYHHGQERLTIRQGSRPCGCQWRIEHGYPGVIYSHRCDTHAPMCRDLEGWEHELAWVAANATAQANDRCAQCGQPYHGACDGR